jgi:hypothetical protein
LEATNKKILLCFEGGIFEGSAQGSAEWCSMVSKEGSLPDAQEKEVLVTIDGVDTSSTLEASHCSSRLWMEQAGQGGF